MPQLTNLFIYPIKSLDRAKQSQASVLASGALTHDREFALVDERGQFVNGKRFPAIHRLRAAWSNHLSTVTLGIQDRLETVTFHLEQDQAKLEQWLTDYFGFSVQCQRDRTIGFPDDTDSPGPTVISTATLEMVASWYPGLTVEQVRSRFRANLEIAGVPAFWEDQLFSSTGEPIEFQIGTVKLLGINPCQRCIVPTRDAVTGEPLANFQKIFTAQRAATLPAWAAAHRFNHFYRLSVNTRIPASEAGKILHLGDEMKICPSL